MSTGLIGFQNLAFGQKDPPGDLLQGCRNQVHLERGDEIVDPVSRARI